MSIHRTSKSGLFLLELMIVILFFALNSAVCAQLFMTARTTSASGNDLTQSTLAVQTAADTVKAAGGDVTLLCQLLPLTAQPDGTLAAYYDKSWQPATVETQAYTLTIRQQTKANHVLVAQVQMAKGEALIFEVEVKQFLGTKGGTP